MTAATVPVVMECPVGFTLALLASKWKALIICELIVKRQRFSALQHGLGNISQKVLTAALRDLEADGLVRREVFPEVPVRVEYELTELGRSLTPIIRALSQWGVEYKKERRQPLAQTVDAALLEALQLDSAVLPDAEKM